MLHANDSLGLDFDPHRTRRSCYVQCLYRLVRNVSQKFRSYVSCAGRLARLESKAAGVRSRLLRGGAGAPPSPPSPPRRAAARLRRGQFAAPLDHRLPVVLTSCVRVIATYGLRHQGIFRVSGSQVTVVSFPRSHTRPLRSFIYIISL